MVKEGHINISRDNRFGAVVTKAMLVSPTYLKVKMFATKIPNVKTYGMDFRHAQEGVEYRELEHALSGVVAVVINDGHTLTSGYAWDCRYVKQVTEFPHYFCLADGETETDMDVDVEYFAPAPETDAEYYARLMPFLHDAARAFSEQHTPHIAKLTGNSRNALYQVRHAESKNRMESTTLGFQLPIGYATRELDCHRQGKGYILSRADTEKLVKDIHEVFTREDAWWEHHYGHDVRYWNKYHNARQVLLTTPDGTVQSIYDIDSHIRKNLPKIDRDNTKLIEQQGEVEFHNLATEWFSKALYGPREHVKERKLTFQEKT